jgi:hypothetical protein
MKQYNYYNFLGAVNMSDKVHKNCLRFSSAESQEHIMAKLRICQFLKDNIIDFITECRFTKGGRADIFLINSGKSIEILNSEKESNLNIKQSKYPGEIIMYDLKNAPKDFETWCNENLNPNY